MKYYPWISFKTSLGCVQAIILILAILILPEVPGKLSYNISYYIYFTYNFVRFVASQNYKYKKNLHNIKPCHWRRDDFVYHKNVNLIKMDDRQVMWLKSDNSFDQTILFNVARMNFLYKMCLLSIHKIYGFQKLSLCVFVNIKCYLGSRRTFPNHLLNWHSPTFLYLFANATFYILSYTCFFEAIKLYEPL